MTLQAASSSMSKTEGDRQGSIFGLPIVKKQHVPRFLLLGFLTACNVIGNALAIKRLPAITVSIFQPMQPMISGIIAMSIGIERLSLHKCISILVAVVGAMIVVAFGSLASKRMHPGSMNYPVGVPLLLVNVFGSSLCAVFQKKILEEYPPIFVAGMCFMGALAPIFALAACECRGFPRVEWTMGNSNPSALLSLGYAIFFTTTVCYSVIAWANKVTSPTSVMTFISMQPLAAVVVSWLVLHRAPTEGQCIGGALILVALVSFAKAHQLQTQYEAAQRKGTADADQKKGPWQRMQRMLLYGSHEWQPLSSR
eukprot:gnl/TRDRNA2_/TRDRNA2_121906_c2_seq1.p1 gnl/TRDRNA2_/TRDRNA2_121906_c2~~gnl/TRDRNA2_/TRDRNA2_121906_c2_seq1.p1  ORF type:complete len:354 (-),score=59.41 gnl/TRDRNA2_/TRDRNA2_121906_c2_seq1:367-1299(-)